MSASSVRDRARSDPRAAALRGEGRRRTSRVACATSSRRAREPAQRARALRIPRDVRARDRARRARLRGAARRRRRARARSPRRSRGSRRSRRRASPSRRSRAPSRRSPGIGPKRAATLEKRGLATRRRSAVPAAVALRRPPRAGAHRRPRGRPPRHLRGAGAHGRVRAVARPRRPLPPRAARARLGRDRQHRAQVVPRRRGGPPMLTKGALGARDRRRAPLPLLEGADAPGDRAARRRRSDAERAAAVAALRQIVPEYAAPEGVPPRTSAAACRARSPSTRISSRDTCRRRSCATRELPGAARGAAPRSTVPSPDADPEALAQRRTPAHERLVLEELYLLELGLALRRERARARARRRDRDAARARGAPLDALPFRADRARSGASCGEIAADLARAASDEPAAAGRRRQRQDGGRVPRGGRRGRERASRPR